MDVIKSKTRSLRKPLVATGIAVAAITGVLAATLDSRGVRASSDDLVQAELLVETGDLQPEVVALGTIQPLGLHHLAARSDGQVAEVVKQPGERAQAGDVLVVLHNDRLQSDLTALRIRATQASSAVAMARAQASSDIESERAQLVRARANADYAKAEFDARQKVYEAGVVSRLQVAEAQSKVGTTAADVRAGQSRLSAVTRVSEARVASQLAEARIVREELGRMESAVEALKIKAPADGVVNVVDAELGASVSSGTTIVRFMEEKGVFARLRVPEDEVTHVGSGADVEIEAGAKQLKGRVSRVHPTVKDGYVTVDVAIDTPTGHGLAIDSTVRARIKGERLSRASYVRSAAGLGERRVVRGSVKSPAGEVRTGTIELGSRIGDRVLVLAGAEPGDRLVVSAEAVRQQ